MLVEAELALRPMDENDLEDVLRWRNSSNVRENSLDDHVITWNEHKEWFIASNADSTCEWLIAEYCSFPAGVVGISQIDFNNSVCTWSMYLSSDRTIPGLGAFMELRAIDRIFGVHGIRKIWGETLASNSSMVSLHRKFGFFEEGVRRKQIQRGNTFEDVIITAMFAEDWPANRKRVIALLGVSHPVRAGH
jgi:UDP-4-amino-4,6-dideoxy-N-acetyl-beta-L-altrosamine N-acetyltransferase